MGKAFIFKMFRDITIIVVIYLLFILIINLIPKDTEAQSVYYKEILPQEKAETDDVNFQWVSSTEYFLPRDSLGSSIVRLRDSKQNFINTTCDLTILYPSRDVYMNASSMTQDTTYGEYYLHWDVPEEILGVYSQEVSCIVKNKNITNSKTFHVNNLTNIILASNTELNKSLSLIINSFNCSETNSSICTQLDSIHTSIINTSTIIISNLTSIAETLSTFNSTIAGLGNIHYTINAPSCIIGSQWIVEVNATNEENEILPFLDCTLTTVRFGAQNIPYDTTRKTYRIENICDSPEEIVSYDINCVR